MEIEQSEQWENDMLENEGGKDCDMEFGFFTQFNFIFRKAKKMNSIIQFPWIRNLEQYLAYNKYSVNISRYYIYHTQLN